MRFMSRFFVADDDPEITDSIKALKTLTCRGGRVSVEPSEVIDRPGYREARAEASRLIGSHGATQVDPGALRWSDKDGPSLQAWIAQTLEQSRRQGLSVEEAIVSLNKTLKG